MGSCSKLKTVPDMSSVYMSCRTVALKKEIRPRRAVGGEGKATGQIRGRLAAVNPSGQLGSMEGGMKFMSHQGGDMHMQHGMSKM